MWSKPAVLLEAERGAWCADGRGNLIAPQLVNSPLPCEARSLALSVSWIDVSIHFVAHSASRRPITLWDTISFGPLAAPQCMALARLVSLARFQRQEYSRRQYSLEIYLEPTKRINVIDQRRNRFLVSLYPLIRRRVKLVDKTIRRLSLIGR